MNTIVVLGLLFILILVFIVAVLVISDTTSTKRKHVAPFYREPTRTEPLQSALNIANLKRPNGLLLRISIGGLVLLGLLFVISVIGCKVLSVMF
jgi:amino acid transporter